MIFEARRLHYVNQGSHSRFYESSSILLSAQYMTDLDQYMLLRTNWKQIHQSRRIFLWYHTRKTSGIQSHQNPSTVCAIEGNIRDRDGTLMEDISPMLSSIIIRYRRLIVTLSRFLATTQSRGSQKIQGLKLFTKNLELTVVKKLIKSFCHFCYAFKP